MGKIKPLQAREVKLSPFTNTDETMQVSDHITLHASPQTIRRAKLSSQQLRKELADDELEVARWLEQRRLRREYGYTNRYGSAMFPK